MSCRPFSKVNKNSADFMNRLLNVYIFSEKIKSAFKG